MDERRVPAPQAEPLAGEALERPRRVLTWAALALLGLAGLAALLDARARGPVEEAAPALRLPARRDDCAASGGARVLRALASEVAAGTKIQRYPYAPAEGRRALQLLLEAESCFQLAGRTRQADAAARRARGLAARLQRDYADQLIRYRGALSAGRPEQALHAVEVLLELLAGEHGPFVVRLQRLQQELVPHSPQDNP